MLQNDKSKSSIERPKMKKGNQNRHNLVAANRQLVVFVNDFGGGGGSRTLKTPMITDV